MRDFFAFGVIRDTITSDCYADSEPPLNSQILYAQNIVAQQHEHAKTVHKCVHGFEPSDSPTGRGGRLIESWGGLVLRPRSYSLQMLRPPAILSLDTFSSRPH